MKFDVMRASDQHAGRIGKNAEAPTPGCVFDASEDMWVLDVKDLDQLMAVIDQHGAVSVVWSPPDLPVLYLKDV